MSRRGLIALTLVVSIASAAAPPKTATFRVVDMSASITGSAFAAEKPDGVELQGPYFQANASVECAVPSGETWKVGFIQEVDRSATVAAYDDARVEWDYPALPIGDCLDNPPWYGWGSPVAIVDGENGSRTISLWVYDRPWRNAPWDDAGTARQGCELRSVSFDFAATTWLIARREPDGAMTVLRKCPWSVSAHLSVERAQSLGRRATLVETHSVPHVVDAAGETVPAGALTAPCANAARSVWRIDSTGRRTRLKT